LRSALPRDAGQFACHRGPLAPNGLAPSLTVSRKLPRGQRRPDYVARQLRLPCRSGWLRQGVKSAVLFSNSARVTAIVGTVAQIALRLVLKRVLGVAHGWQIVQPKSLIALNYVVAHARRVTRRQQRTVSLRARAPQDAAPRAAKTAVTPCDLRASPKRIFMLFPPERMRRTCLPKAQLDLSEWENTSLRFLLVLPVRGGSGKSFAAPPSCSRM
jgi:hypothetical protein